MYEILILDSIQYPAPKIAIFANLYIKSDYYCRLEFLNYSGRPVFKGVVENDYYNNTKLYVDSADYVNDFYYIDIETNYRALCFDFKNSNPRNITVIRVLNEDMKHFGACAYYFTPQLIDNNASIVKVIAEYDKLRIF